MCENRQPLQLYHFARGESVTRTAVHEAVHVTSDALDECLRRVAVDRGQRTWSFRLPRDEQFELAHAPLVDWSRQLWSARWTELQTWMRDYATVMAAASRRRQRKRSTSIRGSVSAAPGRHRHATGGNSTTIKDEDDVKCAPISPKQRRHSAKPVADASPALSPQRSVAELV